jgi:hypothetical protein
MAIIFWQSYEENQVQKIRHTIHHTILKKQLNRYLYQQIHFARIYSIATPDSNAAPL